MIEGLILDAEVVEISADRTITHAIVFRIKIVSSGPERAGQGRAARSQQFPFARSQDHFCFPAHRIGKVGQYACPEIDAARRRVEAAALAQGKRCMSVGLLLDAPPLMLRGYSLVNLASDVVGLGGYLTNKLASFEEPLVTSPAISLYSSPSENGESLAATK